MLQVWSCDAITGEKIDLLDVADVSWERRMSARGDASVTVPVTSGERSLIADLTRPWQRIIVIEIDGTVVFGGYVLGTGYKLGQSVLSLELNDVWTLFSRRGGWDRDHPYTPHWSTTVTGVLGEQAWQAIRRGRDTGLSTARFPVTRVSVGGGDSVTRKVWGYHLEMIGDHLRAFMDEGLDIYMKPRWLDGKFDWGFYAGPHWASGREVDLPVTVDDPAVTALDVTVNAARVTTNAVRIGEGSEVDMLGRSRSNDQSPYPVLDRITPVKTVSDVVQLDSMALEDLRLYGTPTEHWEVTVPMSEAVDVGDVAWLHVSGSPVIADGWHERRVVSVSGGAGSTKKLGMQPVGGA